MKEVPTYIQKKIGFKGSISRDMAVARAKGKPLINDPKYGDPDYLLAIRGMYRLDNQIFEQNEKDVEFIKEDKILANIPDPDDPRQYHEKRTTKFKHSKRLADPKERLQELMFDPLHKMVEMYEEISYEIRNLERIRSGMKSGKYSPHAHSALLVTKQKLINDLVPYGYAKIATDVNLKIGDLDTPTTFILEGISENKAKLVNDPRIQDNTNISDAIVVDNQTVKVNK
jgi:hypothetical protein